jgi:hypothetical protein
MARELDALSAENAEAEHAHARRRRTRPRQPAGMNTEHPDPAISDSESRRFSPTPPTPSTRSERQPVLSQHRAMYSPSEPETETRPRRLLTPHRAHGSIVRLCLDDVSDARARRPTRHLLCRPTGNQSLTSALAQNEQWFGPTAARLLPRRSSHRVALEIPAADRCFRTKAATREPAPMRTGQTVLVASPPREARRDRRRSLGRQRGRTPEVRDRGSDRVASTCREPGIEGPDVTQGGA